jgi:hypothetical protein
VSQFVRLEQCERFLRFRLAERAGQKFMEDYDVTPQRITPLLSLSGHEFEEGVEKALGSHFRTVHYAARASQDHNRPENNREVITEARKLKPGKSVLLFQPRLSVELAGWLLRGNLDLVCLERQADGTLLVLIGDMKSTVEVKVEHRRRVPARSPPPSRGVESGQAEDDPSRLAQHLLALQHRRGDVH